MDPTVELILAEYERRSVDEAKIMHSQPEEFARRIDDFLISVGPATGRMLHLLATGANAKSILELGSSYGYSTIWLADAARATGGKVVSLELSQRKVDHAQAQLSACRARGLRRVSHRQRARHAAAPRGTLRPGAARRVEGPVRPLPRALPSKAQSRGPGRQRTTCSFRSTPAPRLRPTRRGCAPSPTWTRCCCRSAAAWN